MLKASALFYALIFSIVAGFSVMMLLLLMSTYSHANARLNNEKKLLLNLSSVRVLIESGNIEISELARYDFDLFGSGFDSVSILKRSFGLLDFYKCTSYGKGQNKSDYSLYGYAVPLDQIALFIPSSTYPLKVCGDTKIEGPALVPLGIITPASINGINYLNEKLGYDIIEPSSSEMLKLQMDPYRKILNQSIIYPKYDTLVSLEYLNNMKHISYTSKRHVLWSESNLNLDSLKVSGNVFIYCEKQLFIGHKTELEDVVVFGENVILEDFVTGRFQVFASGSLVLGKNTKLLYPSNIGLINETLGTENSLIMGKGSEVQGGVLIYSENVKSGNSPYLILGENSRIWGVVYSNHEIQLERKITINRGLICKGLFLKNGASKFYNHLLDTKITPYKIPKFYVDTYKGYQLTHSKRIQCLN